MTTGRFIFHRNVSSTVKRIYHQYDPEKDGPKCKRTIKDPVVVGNMPSNRIPCGKCFNLKRRPQCPGNYLRILRA